MLLHATWVTALVALLGFWACDHLVVASSRSLVVDAPAALPILPVALVLGTAPTVRGRPNPFYSSRIEAAAALWRAGRVRGIIVSGDNGRVDYDEPSAMQADLVAAGVPTTFITRDHAGFRTLDSVLRAQVVFGQSRFVVVSQRFHAQRAVFLARHLGCEAWGYAAAEPAQRSWQLRARAREVLARAMAVVDVVIDREPRHLGTPELVALREAPPIAP
jgi:SanA protein